MCIAGTGKVQHLHRCPSTDLNYNGFRTGSGSLTQWLSFSESVALSLSGSLSDWLFLTQWLSLSESLGLFSDLVALSLSQWLSH